MAKIKEDQYAFPCAIIRANEKTLLDPAALDRVLESDQIDQAMNVLAEFGYGDGKELASPRDFEMYQS